MLSPEQDRGWTGGRGLFHWTRQCHRMGDSVVIELPERMAIDYDLDFCSYCTQEERYQEP